MSNTPPGSESQHSARRSDDHRGVVAGSSAFPLSRTALGEALKQVFGGLNNAELERNEPYYALEARLPKRRPKFPSGPKFVPESGGFRYQGTGFRGSWGYGAPAYRSFTRSEISSMKKEMKVCADILKEGTMIYKECSEQMRLEHQKIKGLIEDYANMLKAALETEAACMNMSREQAIELKVLIDEMKEALKSLKGGRKFKLDKFQDYARGARACCELGENLAFFAMYVSGVLVLLGYLKLEDPAPFNPRETKAGRLLLDDFHFGLTVSSKSCVNATDTITSMLSGEMNALQSKVIMEMIQENWSCQLNVSPGHDVLLKGGIHDLWAKGYKVDFNLPLFDGAERRMVLKVKHPFGSLEGKLSLNASPLLSLNAMFGSKHLSGGYLVDYDTLHGIVSRLALGGVLDMFGLLASFMMAKIFQPQAAGQQAPQPAVRHEFSTSLHLEATESTFVGAQLTHRMEDHHTTVAVGVKHLLGAGTFIKGKLTNEWHLTGLLKHNIGAKSYVSVCTTVDLQALHAAPGFGLSVSIAP